MRMVSRYPRGAHPSPTVGVPPSGVCLLYVSPLKALNNEIHRNMQAPLASVLETAQRIGCPLPELTAAVRTGDTPAAERQRFLRHLRTFSSRRPNRRICC